MARLSAENTAEHLASIKTPTSSTKKSNRFKDLFKGGHSRNSMTSNNASPSVSPGGIENFKPGFEKVGLHPSERSRILDLDLWERVKEENSELTHYEKIKIYKEKEKMQKREDGGREPGSPLQSPDKAKKVLGIGEIDAEEERAGKEAVTQFKDNYQGWKHQRGKSLDDELKGLKPDERMKVAYNIWKQDRAKKAEAIAKLEADRKACEGSSAFEADENELTQDSLDAKMETPLKAYIASGSDIHETELTKDTPDAKMEASLKAFSAYSSDIEEPKLAEASSGAAIHPALRHSLQLANIRSSARNQVRPEDSISLRKGKKAKGTNKIDISQEIKDAVDLHEFRFHRFGLADINNSPGSQSNLPDSPPNASVDRIRAKILMQLNTQGLQRGSSETSIATSVATAPTIFKIGPFKVDASRAEPLEKPLVPIIYFSGLFVQAMQGPVNFFMAVWQFAVVAITYYGVRMVLGWDKDGSRDVLLAPIQELGIMIKDFGLNMVLIALEVLTHAIIVALKEAGLFVDV